MHRSSLVLRSALHLAATALLISTQPSNAADPNSASYSAKTKTATYSLTYLTPFNPVTAEWISSSTYATGVNKSGVVVGTADYLAAPGVSHIVLWREGKITDLGEGRGYGINDRGDIVGVKSETPVLIQEGRVTALPTLGATSITPTGINNAGQIIGNSNLGGILWDGRRAVLLGANSSVSAVNESGQIAGSIGNRAVIWTNTVPQYLDPPGVPGAASGINDKGEAVGVRFDYGPMLWKNGKATLLDPLPNNVLTQSNPRRDAAFSINNDGVIVGSTAELNENATVWIDGKAYLLADMTKPGSSAPLGNGPMVRATKVNNCGRIIGQLYMYVDNSFLLDPIKKSNDKECQ